MSDVEEPPMKVTKIDFEVSTIMEGDELIDDGQEEWLSEEGLTDDDYQVASQPSQNSEEISQDDETTMGSLPDTTEQKLEELQESTDTQESKIQAEDVTDSKIQEDDVNDTQDSNLQEEEITDMQDSQIPKKDVTDVQVNKIQDEVITNMQNSKIQEENITDMQDGKIQEENVTDVQDSKIQKNITDMQDGKIQEDNITKMQDSKVQEENITNMQDSEIQRAENIEAVLNNFENTEEEKLDAEVTEKELNGKKGTDDDDGNDTDDLLRMLGDDNSKKKKQLHKLRQDVSQKDESSDDSGEDEYIFKNAKVTRLRVAKNAIIRQQKVTKAEPEDMSDTDSKTVAKTSRLKMAKNAVIVHQGNSKLDQGVKRSNDRYTDDSRTIKNMFVNKNTAAKQTSKMIPIHRNFVSKPESSSVVRREMGKQPHSTPRPRILQRPINSKATQSKITPKETEKKIFKSKQTERIILKTKETDRVMPKLKMPERTKQTEKIVLKPKQTYEVIHEEFTEDDEDFEMDDESASSEEDRRSKSEVIKELLNKPEVMDEEIPSDCESLSNEGSLYDEMPSSDSEDLDEWFTIDVRAERAGDYIPLLGSKAYQLLAEEKRCVTERLASLNKSLMALKDSEKQQIDELRKASTTLAELDALISAP